jgi:hypothetical protein
MPIYNYIDLYVYNSIGDYIEEYIKKYKRNIEVNI